jgi:nucleotide-binding universal stress UspA family protein
LIAVKRADDPRGWSPLALADCAPSTAAKPGAAHCRFISAKGIRMYQKILVPIDGSATAGRGLDEAIELARVGGGQLRLIHVVDELSLALAAGSVAAYSADLWEAQRAAGQEVLAGAHERVRAAGVVCDEVLKESSEGRVPDHVIAEAARWGADLIVLGTHGRRGVGRLFMGSDAESIVRIAPVPVLLVRASA